MIVHHSDDPTTNHVNVQLLWTATMPSLQNIHVFCGATAPTSLYDNPLQNAKLHTSYTLYATMRGDFTR